MGDIVNLNRVRKARDKAEARKTATANRVIHGRTGAEKISAKLENERAERRLDGTRLEDDPES